MRKVFNESSAVPYVAPFASFIGLLALRSVLPIPPALEYPFRLLAVSSVVLLVSKPIISLRPSKPVNSVLVGILVFVIWIAPDLIAPEYRNYWVFSNSLTGTPESSIPPAVRSNHLFLVFRLLGTALLVPIIEELFWRGWLIRYLINPDFYKVRFGSYSHFSFWSTAVLFATEHGPFWDVGLAAGIIYNWWMLRTRTLADCILAHSITNTCLAVYVLLFDKWQYWL